MVTAVEPPSLSHVQMLSGRVLQFPLVTMNTKQPRQTQWPHITDVVQTAVQNFTLVTGQKT